MMIFDERRTYGVEIEVLERGVSQFEIAQVIRAAGVESQNEWYNHETKNYWKVITDSSAGYEIVSPVLRGHDGLEQIKKVCEALQSIGCKVDKRCGLHVHHGVDDYSIKNFKTLYITYAKYEKALDSVLPNSRRDDNNTYCQSLMASMYYVSNAYNELVEKIEKCKTVNDISGVFHHDRYYKLNIQSYVKYGTIEFRHHSGTIDADKIINWVMLTQAMVTKGKNGSVVKKSEKEYNEIGYLLHVLGVLKTTTCSEEYYEMGKFFKRRMRELNKNVEAMAA